MLGTSGSGIAALPNLTKVHLTAARVNGRAAALVRADAIQLTNSSGQPIATPSNPDAAGSAFNDCAWKMTCSAP